MSIQQVNIMLIFDSLIALDFAFVVVFYIFQRKSVLKSMHKAYACACDGSVEKYMKQFLITELMLY